MFNVIEHQEHRGVANGADQARLTGSSPASLNLAPPMAEATSWGIAHGSKRHQGDAVEGSQRSGDWQR